jgi:hypothetical protein
MPIAVSAKPALSVGHGFVPGALATLTNDSTANTMPATMRSQPRTRTRDRNHACATEVKTNETDANDRQRRSRRGRTHERISVKRATAEEGKR